LRPRMAAGGKSRRPTSSVATSMRQVPNVVARAPLGDEEGVIEPEPYLAMPSNDVGTIVHNTNGCLSGDP
jgi:hypothetical protein